MSYISNITQANMLQSSPYTPQIEAHRLQPITIQTPTSATISRLQPVGEPIAPTTITRLHPITVCEPSSSGRLQPMGQNVTPSTIARLQPIPVCENDGHATITRLQPLCETPSITRLHPIPVCENSPTLTRLQPLCEATTTMSEIDGQHIQSPHGSVQTIQIGSSPIVTMTTIQVNSPPIITMTNAVSSSSSSSRDLHSKSPTSSSYEDPKGKRRSIDSTNNLKSDVKCVCSLCNKWYNRLLDGHKCYVSGSDSPLSKVLVRTVQMTLRLPSKEWLICEHCIKLLKDADLNLKKLNDAKDNIARIKKDLLELLEPKLGNMKVEVTPQARKWLQSHEKRQRSNMKGQLKRRRLITHTLKNE